MGAYDRVVVETHKQEFIAVREDPVDDAIPVHDAGALELLRARALHHGQVDEQLVERRLGIVPDTLGLQDGQVRVREHAACDGRAAWLFDGCRAVAEADIEAAEDAHVLAVDVQRRRDLHLVVRANDARAMARRLWRGLGLGAGREVELAIPLEHLHVPDHVHDQQVDVRAHVGLVIASKHRAPHVQRLRQPLAGPRSAVRGEELGLQLEGPDVVAGSAPFGHECVLESEEGEDLRAGEFRGCDRWDGVLRGGERW